MMGYYSTVYFACNRDQHKLILAATELEPDTVHSQETSNDEEIYCCEWNYVKWGYTQDANDFEPRSLKICDHMRTHMYLKE